MTPSNVATCAQCDTELYQDDLDEGDAFLTKVDGRTPLAFCSEACYDRYIEEE